MTTQNEDDFRERNPVKSWNPAAAVARCWMWALPMGVLLASATAFYMVSSFEPKYRASALFEARSSYGV